MGGVANDLIGSSECRVVYLCLLTLLMQSVLKLKLCSQHIEGVSLSAALCPFEFKACNFILSSRIHCPFKMSNSEVLTLQCLRLRYIFTLMTQNRCIGIYSHFPSKQSTNKKQRVFRHNRQVTIARCYEA